MNNLSIRRAIAVILYCLLILPPPVLAEQKQEFGDYEIHYIALPSTLLEPGIAQQYGLVRSKIAGFLNISVLKNQPDGSKKPVAAFVKGTITNLLQQQRQLEFTRVSEGQALYQLANFWYSQGEMMTFRLEIQADPNLEPFAIRFSQALYPD